ncbi:MAG: hypothetical protein V4695_00560 [Pseudomonadota bacterium]
MNNSTKLKMAALSLMLGTAVVGCKGSSEQSSAIPSGVPGQAMQNSSASAPSGDATGSGVVGSGVSGSGVSGSGASGTGMTGGDANNAPGMAAGANGQTGSTTQSTQPAR